MSARSAERQVDLIWRAICQVGVVKRCPRPSPWTPLRWPDGAVVTSVSVSTRRQSDMRGLGTAGRSVRLSGGSACLQVERARPPLAGGFVLIGRSRVARRRCRHHCDSSGHLWCWSGPGSGCRIHRRVSTRAVTLPDRPTSQLPADLHPSRRLHRVGGVNVQRPQRSEDERRGHRGAV